METTTRSSKKSTKATAQRIEELYKNYLLTEGRQPASVYKFCLDLGIKESEFYDQFASFDAIENKIWKDFIDVTVSRLHSDKSFHEFSTQEKVLTFYFSFFEELKANRSFVLQQLKPFRKLEMVPSYLKDFKKSFESFFASILEIGKTKGEIAKRPYLDKGYPQLFWFHLGFLLMFWKNDNSPAFEKTDAAIEKSVNLVFDLIGKGALDTAIDFAKFIYQNSKF